MKKGLLALCVGSALTHASMIVGFGVDANYYNPTVSGDFSYTDNGATTSTSFADNTQDSYQIGAYFEHPIPVIPNVRIDYTPDTTFSGTDSIAGKNEVAFKQLDGTLYYEILDNIVDLDVGITFKAIDGNLKGSVNQDFSGVIPMGYLGTAVKIPMIPITIVGDVKYLGYDGDAITDARIKAIWNIVAGVQAQAGLRYESIKIKSQDNVDADVTFKGPFIGVGYSF